MPPNTATDSLLPFYLSIKAYKKNESSKKKQKALATEKKKRIHIYFLCFVCKKWIKTQRQREKYTIGYCLLPTTNKNITQTVVYYAIYASMYLSVQ